MVFKLIASSPDNIGMMKDFTEFDDLVRSFMLLQGGCTADDTPSVRGRVEISDILLQILFLGSTLARGQY